MNCNSAPAEDKHKVLIVATLAILMEPFYMATSKNAVSNRLI